MLLNLHSQTQNIYMTLQIQNIGLGVKVGQYLQYKVVEICKNTGEDLFVHDLRCSHGSNSNDVLYCDNLTFVILGLSLTDYMLQ